MATAQNRTLALVAGPAVLSLLAPLAAQRTIIVDASGGGDFLDIPPAMAAASVDDRIVVRSGTYSGFVVDKGLVISGAPAAVLDSITVRDLPRGQTAIIDGFQADWARGLEIAVYDCAGRVQLQRISALDLLRVSGKGSFASARSDAVSLHECEASYGMHSEDSQLSLEDCRFFGSSDCSSTAPAVVLRASAVSVSGGDLHGGSGSYTFQCGLPAPSPAVRMTGGSLRVAGAAELHGAVSSGVFSGKLYASAIESDGGRVELDPSVSLVSAPAPPTSGTSIFVTTPVPAVRVASVPAGGTLETELHGPPSALVGLLASTTALPGATPFGPIWLDPARSISLFAGTLPGSGRTTLQIPLHPVFSPPGTTFTFQAAAVVQSTLSVGVPTTVTVQLP